MSNIQLPASELRSGEGHTPTSRGELLRLSGWFQIAGGAMFLAMYGLEIAFGLRESRLFMPPDAPTSLLARGGQMALTLGLLCLAIGLFQLARWLHGARPRLATASMILVSVGFVALPLNLVLLLGLVGQPMHVRQLMVSVPVNLAVTTLLSIGALQTRALSRGAGIALLCVGLVTFPWILLADLLLPLLPDYIVTDIPFLAWGVVAIIAGRLIWRQAGQPVHRSR